jgi:hypothetical protein
LPPHLPRVETVVDVEDKRCPRFGGPMHVIGADVAEMLDVVSALYQGKVIRRLRCECRDCEGAVVQPPAPERPLTGGMSTEALLAQVLAPSTAIIVCPEHTNSDGGWRYIGDEGRSLGTDDQESVPNQRELLS